MHPFLVRQLKNNPRATYSKNKSIHCSVCDTICFSISKHLSDTESITALCDECSEIYKTIIVPIELGENND